MLFPEKKIGQYIFFQYITYDVTITVTWATRWRVIELLNINSCQGISWTFCSVRIGSCLIVKTHVSRSCVLPLLSSLTKHMTVNQTWDQVLRPHRSTNTSTQGVSTSTSTDELWTSTCTSTSLIYLCSIAQTA